MGYQRDDRYGGDRWRDRDQSREGGGWDRDRDNREEGRAGRGWSEGRREEMGWGPGAGGDRGGARCSGGSNDRGFFERAGEEVRSWFGGDDDDRPRGGRPTSRGDNGYDDRGSDYGPGGSYGYMSNGWGNQSGESWNRDRPGERGWFGGSGDEQRGERLAGPGDRDPAMTRQAGGGRGRDLHDPHYSEWRRRQIEELDRDYDEYRREHQSKFEQEFGTWRSTRQGQREMLGKVEEKMTVLGSEGTPVGTVDKVRRDRIILAKSDEAAGGVHHSIPCGWIESVDERVTVNKTAQQALSQWESEEQNRALFESGNEGSDGPHMLNRSFSGTYTDRDE